ncbi:MAG: hypothetical protein L3J69_04250 [Desulfobacula sp.]|nr:hypothetical protein [Desulfobacula sp.]
MSAQTTGEVLIRIFIYVNFFSLAFVSFFFIITGIRMLKKLNDPVTKLITGLKTIQNGNLSEKIILRRADEFSDVAESMDKMRKAIKNQFINSKYQYKKIADEIQNIETEELEDKLKDKKIKKIIYMVQQLREPNQKF